MIFILQVFSSGKVHYAGQSLGLIVAETPSQAQRAAREVQVRYKDQRAPVLNIEDAIKSETNVMEEKSVTVGEVDVFQEGVGES